MKSVVHDKMGAKICVERISCGENNYGEKKSEENISKL